MSYWIFSLWSLLITKCINRHFKILLQGLINFSLITMVTEICLSCYCQLWPNMSSVRFVYLWFIAVENHDLFFVFVCVFWRNERECWFPSVRLRWARSLSPRNQHLIPPDRPLPPGLAPIYPAHTRKYHTCFLLSPFKLNKWNLIEDMRSNFEGMRNG